MVTVPHDVRSEIEEAIAHTRRLSVDLMALPVEACALTPVEVKARMTTVAVMLAQAAELIEALLEGCDRESTKEDT